MFGLKRIVICEDIDVDFLLQQPVIRFSISISYFLFLSDHRDVVDVKSLIRIIGLNRN